MSKKLAKYIITTGPFDYEANNIRQARKNLKNHAENMRDLYDDKDSYGLYMLVEQIKGKK